MKVVGPIVVLDPKIKPWGWLKENKVPLMQGRTRRSALEPADIYQQKLNMEFLEIVGTILGVPIIRILIFRGLYWGPPVLGHYHMHIHKTIIWISEAN